MKRVREKESERMGNVPQQDLGVGESLIDYDDSAVKQGLAVACLLWMTALGMFCCSVLPMIGFQGQSHWLERLTFLRRSISIERRLRQVREARLRGYMYPQIRRLQHRLFGISAQPEG